MRGDQYSTCLIKADEHHKKDGPERTFHAKSQLSHSGQVLITNREDEKSFHMPEPTPKWKQIF